MNRIAWTLLLACTAVSCHKSDEAEATRYSTWYINGEKHTTADVQLVTGKIIADLNGKDDTATFSFSFYSGDVPVNMHMALLRKGETFSGHQVDVLFSMYGSSYVAYVPSPYSNTVIIPGLVDGKVEWTMDTTWFVNYDDDADSVQIWGKFLVP